MSAPLDRPSLAKGTRAFLLRGVSGSVLTLALASTPAHAQLNALRAQLGIQAGIPVVPTTGSASPLTPAITPTMTQIVARHKQYQEMIQGQQAIVASANAAARAAAQAAQKVTMGAIVDAAKTAIYQSTVKINPTDVSATPATQTVYYTSINSALVRLDPQRDASGAIIGYTQAGAIEGTAPGGLVHAAYVPSVTALATNAASTTGLNVWQGASLPGQTTDATTGAVNVTINQTDSRALLSWSTFNIGRDTTLTFNQQGHSDWIAVNRVVGGIDPVTGLRTPDLAPSQIFGKIKADGKVYILNRSGILFGATSQINLNSLVASSLEIGQTIYKNPQTGTGQPAFLTKSVSDLNTSYLQNGILPATHSAMLGYIRGESHGDVTMDRGAQIASTGGFVILAAPKVSVAGEINPTVDGTTGKAITPAAGSQVSIVAGNLVDAQTATGADGTVDPYVRGLVVTSVGGGNIDVSGSINAPQGYVSLVTDRTGTVDLSGLIGSSTSVSRNGKVALIGGTVNLSSRAVLNPDGTAATDTSGAPIIQRGSIAITADLSGSTIPQSADSVAAFKRSQVDIGNFYLETSATGFAQIQSANLADGDPFAQGTLVPTLFPSLVSIGTKSILYTPSANVNIGNTTGGKTYTPHQLNDAFGPTGITIADGAVIDVSGLDSVQLAATRNQITIAPAKKNELRDTPNYRDTTTDGSFSLNGQTLYADARISGVRSDGVAWVGSPLLDAGSAVAQIGVTAPELMTKGGNVTLATLQANVDGSGFANLPSITIGKAAAIDFSGGWVSYDAGFIRSTKLVTTDGRVVDISVADPNDRFAGVAGGFIERLPQLSNPLIYNNPLTIDSVFSEAYTEGRDAGSLTLSAPTMSLNAGLHGDAVIGARQAAGAVTGTASSAIKGDLRKLQGFGSQLPTAGYLHVDASAMGGSILFGGTSQTGPDGQTQITAGGQSFAPTAGLIHIAGDTVNNANLAALSLQTSGAVIFSRDSTLNLTAGGALTIDAGRTISFNGSISVPSGTISARTRRYLYGDIFDSTDDLNNSFALPSNYILSGPIAAPCDLTSCALPGWQTLMTLAGAPADKAPGWFDIVLASGASLSARGRWTNDFLNAGAVPTGSAYTSGGSISLIVAPHIAATQTDTKGALHAIDISGSIALQSGSLVDLAGGGYVSTTGGLRLTGKGGNLSLIDETVYFQTSQSNTGLTGSESTLPSAPRSTDLFLTDAVGIPLKPLSDSQYFLTALVPDSIRSTVDISDTADIRSFGFAGGGTFKLVAPNLDFNGSGRTPTSTRIGDFLDRTGFGTLDLSAWKTQILGPVFTGTSGNSALLATQMLTIGDGQTLDLTQTILPSILTVDQGNALRSTNSGEDISRLALLAPTKTLGAYDNRAAKLILGGLTELDVMAGGTITGAAGASITVPKLYSAGTISIMGGAITQSEYLPLAYVRSGISGQSAIGIGQQTGDGPVDYMAAFAEIFGPRNSDGLYDQSNLVIGRAASAFDERRIDSFLTRITTDHQIYLLGRLDQNQGILFTGNSRTDLSGGFIQNPRASITPAGTPVATGRLIDGGSIRALGRSIGAANLFVTNDSPADQAPYQISNSGAFKVTGQRAERRIDAERGALIDISGASAAIDVTTPAGLTRTAVGTNAGTLSGLGGGDVSQATIRANAGIGSAQGGTFEWYSPTLTQSAASDGTLSTANIVSADQLQQAGFDSLVARGRLSTLGDVTLNLGRSFLVGSPDSLDTSDSNTFNYYDVVLDGTGNLSVTAPHIALSSIRQSFSNLSGTTGNLNLNLRAQAATGTGASFDLIGAINFGRGFGTVTLSSAGDIRLIGVGPTTNTLAPTATLVTPSLSGGLLAAGRLTMQARSIYATSGTGNLIQDPAAAKRDPNANTQPYIIASLAPGQVSGVDTPSITFRREAGSTATAPLSAATHILVLGESILQGGALYAPFGEIDLGARAGFNPRGVPYNITTNSLTLTADSITSVSGKGLNIPFGITTDLTDYFFSPTYTGALKTPPAPQLTLSAGAITTEAGATVDGSGGGDLYAYEFVSGTGGSRDVLSRFNTDQFTGNKGFQFADGRQVYAILPANSPEAAALFDPIYSGDYGNLYGSEVGKMVRLDAVPASGTLPGLAGGDYILLPAKYAMLPGAMRIVENVGSAAPLAGQPLRQLDQSILVGGTYGIAGTGVAETVRRSFTVASQEVFSKYSKIQTTSAATFFTSLADRSGAATPRLPNDAAHIVIDPGTLLSIGSSFSTAAATDKNGKSGRGSQVDIVGDVVNIVAGIANAGKTGVNLSTDDLAKINAASLLIGGTRTDNADGTTSVDVSASEIHVRNYSSDATTAAQSISLAAPEILFAVQGKRSILDISDAAVITASGTLTDSRTGAYDLTVADPNDPSKRLTSFGAFFRVANGPDRYINRLGTDETTIGLNRAQLSLGAASVSGQSMLLDSSRRLRINAGATLGVQSLGLSSNLISFSSRRLGTGTLLISPDLEAKLAAIPTLTLLSPNAIGFSPLFADGALSSHKFQNLVIDAPGVRVVRAAASNRNRDTQTVQIDANNITLRNDYKDLGDCTRTGRNACGTTGNSLILNATGTLTLGSGTFRTYGFDKQVAINAASGVYYSGEGTLKLGTATLTLSTPFIADLGTGVIPDAKSVQANYEIDSSAAVTINAVGAATASAQTALLAPGARFAVHALGAKSALSITDTAIRATAGTIDLQSTGTVTVAGNASLAAPSYKQVFGPKPTSGTDPDQVTVSASAGTVAIQSNGGDILFSGAPRIGIGGTSGGAGRLSLLAAQGTVDLNQGGTVDSSTLSRLIDASAPNAGASLNLDSAKGGFDLAGFIGTLGTAFTGDIAIRSGLGDLALNAGQTLKATSVSLTADGGATRIGGRIDTSGVNGGAINLYGRDLVTLDGTAVLDAHSTGYAATDTRKAKAGDVTLGVGQSGAIRVAAGANIDLSVNAARAGENGYRAIGKQQTDPVTRNQITSYTIVEADQGGTLTLRAPVVTGTDGSTVDVRFGGTITGTPSDVSVVGYKAVDLATVDTGRFSGVTVANGVATLDVGAKVDGKVNLLSDEAAGTIPDFIQNFRLSFANGALGSLTDLGSTLHLKPGVELNYSGDITLASTWNLGAGRITNYAGALAAGDLTVSDLSVAATLANGKPTTVYNVVDGRQGDLFQNFVHMLYRTGTGVNTGGEAAAFTLRASNNLNITHSISDGFFNFADQTDRTYLTYQLGGGTLLFNPTFNFSCGGGDCSNLVNFPSVAPGQKLVAPKPIQSLTFNLSKPNPTLIGVLAPYSDTANSAAAFSQGTTGGGDPLGGAELFPLLSVTDTNGTVTQRAAASSDIQLIGGAGAIASANPLHIDRGSGGSVTISGSTSYDISTSSKANGVYFGPPIIQSTDVGVLKPSLADLVNLPQLLAQALSSGQNLSNASTRVNLGSAPDFEQAARDFVDAHPGQATFINTRKNPNGIITTLDLAVQFILSNNIIPTLSANAQGTSTGATGGRVQDAGTVTVRSLVRTGTGSIDIAAGKDVDLTNGPQLLRNKNLGKFPSERNPTYQLGGTAVYTAGHLVQPQAVSVAGLTIDPTTHLPTAPAFSTLWLPDIDGRLQAKPVFATGGGDVAINAGNDILGRRDLWSENVATGGGAPAPTVARVERKFTADNMIGVSNQRWRVGQIGGKQDDILGSTYIQINAQGFTSGVATLGGGDVSLHAGHDLNDLTVALDTTLATADVGKSFGAMIFGGGDLDVRVGGDIAGGRFDIASGTANFHANENVGSSGKLGGLPTLNGALASSTSALRDNLPEIRISDTVVNIYAAGRVALASVSALGTDSTSLNSLGNYSGTSAINIAANGDVSIAGGPAVGGDVLTDGGTVGATAKVLPASLGLTSLRGNIDLGALNNFLYPSATGQLSLLAGGTLAKGTLINMDDGDPSLLPGLYSAYRLQDVTSRQIEFGRPFVLPAVLPNTSDSTRRLYHYADFVSSRDNNPVRLAVNGTLNGLTLYAPKQARISAGQDIVNMVFIGQNLSGTDATRIVAGRDITSTNAISSTTDINFAAANGRLLTQGSYFALGGAGAFYMEAGRDLGPFLNSATISNFVISGSNVTKTSGTLNFGGGILAVGNDFNPWLASKSADIFAFFGVANGMDFTALREAYLNPANLAALPGDLFEQNVDTFGNQTPDRSRPVYATILIDWMKQNQADLLTSLYGTTNVTFQQAYDAFAGKAGLTDGLPEFTQRKFLLDKVYFKELAAASDPSSNSQGQFGRGYLAAQTLFPPESGYTDNFVHDANGAVVTDPATGFPARYISVVGRKGLSTTITLLDGSTVAITPVTDNVLVNPVTQAQVTPDTLRKLTGNLDLRLATIQTARDSNITLLGPGGDAILGSVIRTETQAAGRAYQPTIFGSYLAPGRPSNNALAFPVLSIPIGYEGILTLRGGSINSFTDGDLRLNQSRLFTQNSGDIALWSSNGDLNAGQGPKSAASVPPLVVRFNPNGGTEVDSASSVVGAGIAGFAGIRRLERNGAPVLDDGSDTDAANAIAQLAALPLGASVTINGKTYRYALTDGLSDPSVAASAAQLSALAKRQTLGIDGKTYLRDTPAIYLLAPAGTVDAGDAGVRAAGDIFVAAAVVANADNFKVGGTSVGIPSVAPAPTVAVPASATAALVANVFRGNDTGNADQRSRITVDILGFFNFNGSCTDAQGNPLENCQ